MRIAIYRNDPTAAQRLAQLLRAAGHRLFLQESRYDLISLLDHSTMDLIVTEWHGLITTDSRSGHWLIREAQKTAVMFITHEDQIGKLPTIIEGNAVDFVSFSIHDDEVLHRIEGLLRRAYPFTRETTRIEVGPYTLDSFERTIRCGDKSLEKMNDRIFKLAFCFFSNIGRPLSRDYLKEFVGGSVGLSASRYLDNTVAQMKSILALGDNDCFVIRSIYGFGYALDIREPKSTNDRKFPSAVSASAKPRDDGHDNRREKRFSRA